MIASTPSVYPAPVVYPALQPAFLTAELPKPDKPLLQPTREENKPATPSTTLTGQVSQTVPPGTPPLDKTGKLPRTKGEYAFDAFLYPVLTNAGVFALSVFFTYMSVHGKKPVLPTDGLLDKFGGALRKRGDRFTQMLQNKFKLSPELSRAGNMLAWSFTDGSVIALAVKLLEDRRKPISQKFDQWFGTTPDNPAVYDQEPKQSWGTVFAGRGVAAASVIPTFGILNYTNEKIPFLKESLNSKMFYKPGEKLGKTIENAFPVVQKTFPKLNIPGLSEVCLFEAFYTSVTTAALYFSSRFFASHHSEKPAPKPLANPPLINATV